MNTILQMKLAAYKLGSSLAEIADMFNTNKQAIYRDLKDLPGYKLEVARRSKSKEKLTVQKAQDRLKAAVKKAPPATYATVAKVLDQAIKAHGEENDIEGYTAQYQSFNETSRGKALIGAYSKISSVRGKGNMKAKKQGDVTHREAAAKLDAGIKQHMKAENIQTYSAAFLAYRQTAKGSDLFNAYELTAKSRFKKY